MLYLIVSGTHIKKAAAVYEKTRAKPDEPSWKSKHWIKSMKDGILL